MSNWLPIWVISFVIVGIIMSGMWFKIITIAALTTWFITFILSLSDNIKRIDY